MIFYIKLLIVLLFLSCTQIEKSDDFEKNDIKLAIGNVRVYSDSGVTLFTDSLLWNNKNEKIFSNDSIMLTTNYNDTLYGIGFESNVDLTHWKIKKPWGVSSEN